MIVENVPAREAAPPAAPSRDEVEDDCEDGHPPPTTVKVTCQTPHDEVEDEHDEVEDDCAGGHRPPMSAKMTCQIPHIRDHVQPQIPRPRDSWPPVACNKVKALSW